MNSKKTKLENPRLEGRTWKEARTKTGMLLFFAVTYPQTKAEEIEYGSY